MDNFLSIMDRDTLLNISYEDMIKYHGRLHIGGVAIAFKVLQLGFSILSPGVIPSRGKFDFASGLGESATGILDGVEMVTRARSLGKMRADTSLEHRIPAPEAPNGGNFYFELGYDGKILALSLKDGLVPEVFIELSRRAMARQLDSQGHTRLQEVKEELAAALMSGSAENLFNYEVL